MEQRLAQTWIGRLSTAAKQGQPRHCLRTENQALASVLQAASACLEKARGAGGAAGGVGTRGRLLDTLGELEAVADDDDFPAAAGALRTILEE